MFKNSFFSTLAFGVSCLALLVALFAALVKPANAPATVATAPTVVVSVSPSVLPTASPSATVSPLKKSFVPVRQVSPVVSETPSVK